MSAIVRPGADYRVVFIEGRDAIAASLQEELIAKLDREGWEWAGFVTTSRAVAVPNPNNTALYIGGATETAGTFLYFKRARTNLESVSPGEAAMLRPFAPRALRRKVAREHAKIRAN